MGEHIPILPKVIELVSIVLGFALFLLLIGRILSKRKKRRQEKKRRVSQEEVEKRERDENRMKDELCEGKGVDDAQEVLDEMEEEYSHLGIGS